MTPLVIWNLEIIIKNSTEFVHTYKKKASVWKVVAWCQLFVIVDLEWIILCVRVVFEQMK